MIPLLTHLCFRQTIPLMSQNAKWCTLATTTLPLVSNERSNAVGNEMRRERFGNKVSRTLSQQHSARGCASVLGQISQAFHYHDQHIFMRPLNRAGLVAMDRDWLQKSGDSTEKGCWHDFRTPSEGLRGKTEGDWPDIAEGTEATAPTCRWSRSAWKARTGWTQRYGLSAQWTLVGQQGSQLIHWISTQDWAVLSSGKISSPCEWTNGTESQQRLHRSPQRHTPSNERWHTQQHRRGGKRVRQQELGSS